MFTCIHICIYFMYVYIYVYIYLYMYILVFYWPHVGGLECWKSATHQMNRTCGLHVTINDTKNISFTGFGVDRPALQHAPEYQKWYRNIIFYIISYQPPCLAPAIVFMFACLFWVQQSMENRHRQARTHTHTHTQTETEKKHGLNTLKTRVEHGKK